jgi:hypothetical protein
MVNKAVVDVLALTFALLYTEALAARMLGKPSATMLACDTNWAKLVDAVRPSAY